MPHPKFHPLLIISILITAIFLLLDNSRPPDNYLPDAGSREQQLAVQLAQRGDLEGGLARLERLLERHPENASLWKDYFSMLHQANRGQDMLAHLPNLAADKLSPDLITVLVDVADATAPEGYALLQDTALSILPESPELAVAIYRRLLPRQPDNAINFLAEAQLQNPELPTLAELLEALEIKAGEVSRH